MTQKEFIQGLEDYKQKTDLFPHTGQSPKGPERIVRKNKKKIINPNQKIKG